MGHSKSYLNGALIALLIAMPLIFLSSARAQGLSRDQTEAVSKKATRKGTSPDEQATWRRKLAGSFAELSTYAGSGTFYSTGYRDPYVSSALFVRPTYDLGTRFKMSANARLYFETEFTKSDIPNGRRFTPYDIWLWLAIKNLHTFEASRVRLGGVLRAVVPISYESRYAHLLTAGGVGLNLSRSTEFGADVPSERRWILLVSVASVFTKNVNTSDLRGGGPGDSSGCRAYVSAGLSTMSFGGPSGSESDRCGGPVNTNFSVTSNGMVALSRGPWSATVLLLVSNAFRYSVPLDSNSSINASDLGRTDSTWGIVSLGYSLSDHVAVSAGLSSSQPALDSRYQHLRFPFFDLSGGANANNFTQAFVSLNGTL